MSEKIKCPRCGGTGKVEQDAVNIGDLIRLHRDGKKLTQEKLAQAAGISRAQIANLESGKTDPSLSLLRRLAAVLDCSPKDLIP